MQVTFSLSHILTFPPEADRRAKVRMMKHPFSAILLSLFPHVPPSPRLRRAGKSDRSARWFRFIRRRGEKSHDLLKNFNNRGFMGIQPRGQLLLNLGQLFCQAPLSNQDLTYLNERPDDKYAHLNGTGSIENSRRHDRTVLGKRSRPITRISVTLRTGHKL